MSDFAKDWNPFYDNHLFKEADIQRAKLTKRDRFLCLLHPMKVQINDGYAWYFKTRRGAIYYYKREPIFAAPPKVSNVGGE